MTTPATELRPSRFATVALLASGVVLGVATLTTPSTGDAAPSTDLTQTTAMIESVVAVRGPFYWNSVLTVVGAGLLLLGLPALVEGGRGRRRLSAVGGALAAVATLGMVALIASSSMALHQLTNGVLDATTAARVWSRPATSGEIGLGIFALPFLVLLPIGFLVLAVALHLTRGLPRWQPVLLGVGAVLAVVVSSPDSWLGRVAPVPFCIAVSVIAFGLLRGPLTSRPVGQGVDDAELPAGTPAG